MFILHLHEETIADRIDTRFHEVPPNEPYELSEYDGKALIEHLWWAGIVEVPVIKNGYQTDLDVEAARKAAIVARAHSDQLLINGYVEAQQIDRLQRAVPALPPSPKVSAAIKRQGVVLSEYGINPVGFKAGEVQKQNDERVATLEKQLEEQVKANAELAEQFKQLMAALNAPPQQTDKSPNPDPLVQTPNQRKQQGR